MNSRGSRSVEHIRSYLESRKRTLEEHKNILEKRKEKIDADIADLTEKQKNFRDPVDVTHEIFSPKPVRVNSDRESIQVLEVKKHELIQDNKQIDSQLRSLFEEEEKIEAAICELEKLEREN